VEREGPRGINRHRYTPEEAAAELERPVVKALHRLCMFRNHHKAFNGQARLSLFMAGGWPSWLNPWRAAQRKERVPCMVAHAGYTAAPATAFELGAGRASN
jgi:hypothetical protein